MIMIMQLSLVVTLGAAIFTTIAAAPALTQALPGCRDKCGDLTIPFPFGIGDGCYLRPEFNLTCDQSTTPPSANLTGHTIRISDFYLAEGELQVMTFASRDCYDTKGLRTYRITPKLWLPPPYTISDTKNKFVAIGCDTYALFQGYRGEEKFITGCMSLCDSLGSVEYQDSYCSGIGCCQTSIPSGLKNCTVQLSSYYNHTFIMDFNPCSYAFIVEQGQFKFNSTSFQQLNSISQIPMVINWEIGDDETCDFVCKADYSKCVNRNTNINGSGYICQCLPGYQGNPYLPHGCQGGHCGEMFKLQGRLCRNFGRKSRVLAPFETEATFSRSEPGMGVMSGSPQDSSRISEKFGAGPVSGSGKKMFGVKR